VTRAETNRREHRMLILMLAVLEVVAVSLLLGGIVWDIESLKVAAYAVGMPVTLALLGNLGLYLTWSDKT
jgi:hypothetical protein